MSKGHRNDRRIARRVRHDMELAQRKRDDRLTRRILDAVAKAPLSDAHLAQVRAALAETGKNGEGQRDTVLEWYPSVADLTGVSDGPPREGGRLPDYFRVPAAFKAPPEGRH